MGKPGNARESVLKASRAYYAHRAYYEDLLAQRQRRFVENLKRELNSLEHTFCVDATCPIKHFELTGSLAKERKLNCRGRLSDFGVISK